MKNSLMPIVMPSFSKSDGTELVNIDYEICFPLDCVQHAT